MFLTKNKLITHIHEQVRLVMREYEMDREIAINYLAKFNKSEREKLMEIAKLTRELNGKVESFERATGEGDKPDTELGDFREAL